MADYCTLAEAKLWLNITTINSDTLISSLITSASAYIDNWTGRTFSTATKTFSVNGNGSPIMMVKYYPITAVSAVSVDGVSYSASNGTSAGYLFDDTTVYLIGAQFNKGIQNVTITLTHGYATIPADIKQVVIELVGKKVKETDRIGIQSKNLAGETITFDISDLKEDNKKVLNNYNRVVPL